MSNTRNWSDLNFWGSPFHKEIESHMKVWEGQVCPKGGTHKRVFKETPFEDVKVVILGQDPYHTPGVADGLAFSTWAANKKIPPSLRNIFQEYTNDLGYPKPRSGDLSEWARNGVLLFNTSLTVLQGRPNSCQHWGWRKLTVEVLRNLSEYRNGVVFILWGKQAQEYKGLIDAKNNRHCILTSSHPSPLSAGRGFFGSRPFSRANTYLTSIGSDPVNWRLR